MCSWFLLNNNEINLHEPFFAVLDIRKKKRKTEKRFFFVHYHKWKCFETGKQQQSVDRVHGQIERVHSYIQCKEEGPLARETRIVGRLHNFFFLYSFFPLLNLPSSYFVLFSHCYICFMCMKKKLIPLLLHLSGSYFLHINIS